MPKSQEPESIDVLCKRLENARDKSTGKKKEIVVALYEQFLTEYNKLIESYFKPPQLNDVTNPAFIESNRQMDEIYKEKAMGIDCKVLMVGHDYDGCIGVSYENSIADAEALIRNGRVFNGPVVLYQFKVVAFTDQNSGRVIYANDGKGKIVLNTYYTPEPKTERCIPIVESKSKDTSHLLVAV
jgi:hypothetical protein